MAYADYRYYRQVYGGKMPEPEFTRLSKQASAYLDNMTSWHITGPLSETAMVRDACCAVADAYRLNEQGGGIASESNRGRTVNYVAGVSKSKTENQRLYEAAALYLGGTGLLYKGR